MIRPTRHTWARAWLFGCVCVVSRCGLAADAPAPFPESWYFEPESVAAMRSLEGERAPEITGVTWEGEPQSLHALRGRIVVLDLWAIWCPACLPALKSDVDLLRRTGPKGVTLLAVHDGSAFGRERWEAAKQAAADRGCTFPLGVDAEQEDKSVMRKYKSTFFPSYVVIDREGIVRAAGIQPDHVEKVVERLLADGAASAPQPEFPPELFVGGEKRLTSYLALEGQPAPAIDAAEWIGTPVDPRAGGITVVQFFSSTSAKSLQSMRTLARQQDELAKLGASIVAVAPPRDDWAKVGTLAKENAWGASVARDVVRDKTDVAGRIASAMGASIHTPCYVIDAKGVMRAVGVKPERVIDVVRHVARHLEKERMAVAPPPPKPELNPKDSRPDSKAPAANANTNAATKPTP